MTRANTSAVLNLTPVHTRAGQLTLIQRWITIERDLLNRLKDNESAARILRAQIVADIVSYCDCLVTRAIPIEAPQRMDGLDVLVANAGHPTQVISRFVGSFAFDAQLQALRDVRDTVSAHLEIDRSVTLGALLKELDEIDLEEALDFFERIKRVFDKVCREVLFLRLYLADGRKLYGVMTGNNTPRALYDGRSPNVASTMPPLPDYDGEEAFRANFETWLYGDEASRGDARHFFWNAFSHSRIVGTVTAEDSSPFGTRCETHEFRAAHKFMLDILTKNPAGYIYVQALELMLECRNGYPWILAQLLVWHAENHSPDWTICYALGEIADWPHDDARRLLLNGSKADSDWMLQFHAILALFKVFGRSEGQRRINHHASRWSYAEEILPLLAGLHPQQELLCAMAFASQYSDRLAAYARQLESEYIALQTRVKELCEIVVPTEHWRPVVEIVSKIVSHHDYVAVCLVVADQMNAAGDATFAEDLLTFACNGWIVTARNDTAVQNYAGCLLRKKEFSRALETAESLASRNPDVVEMQIFVTQVLASMPDRVAPTTEKIAWIRTHYTLTRAQEATLQGLAAHVAAPLA
jgi:hypothetical protein